MRPCGVLTQGRPVAPSQEGRATLDIWPPSPPPPPPTLPLPLKSAPAFPLPGLLSCLSSFSALCDTADGERQAGDDGARTAGLYDSHVLWKHGGYRPVTIIGGSCHKYHFCRDKRPVCRVCRDKKKRLLLRQKYACRDRIFVATSIFLSRQKTLYRDKHVLVATKMILVTAPATDTLRGLVVATSSAARLVSVFVALRPRKPSGLLTPSLPQPVKFPG